VVAVLIAGALSALAVTLALAASQRSFLHIATNLSQAPDYQSNFTHIAIGPNEDRVAVVWPEAYTAGANQPPRGHVLLRWASESAGSGWSNPQTVFYGSAAECAEQAAVAVTDTVAHVAYIVWNPCTDPVEKGIYYRTCTLTPGGGCDPSIEITRTTLLSHEAGFGSVDIALDGQGNPHFAYVYYTWDETPPPGDDVGTIYHRWLDVSHGTLQEESRVSYVDPDPSPPDETEDCNNPAIAWDSGFIHIVWEDEDDFAIRYARSADGSNWNTDRETIVEDSNYYPRNPDVDAHGGEVIVVWDQHWPQPLHEDWYRVVYRRNTNKGESGYWKPLDYTSYIGSGYSTDEADVAEYWTFLRPTVGLDGNSPPHPTVVWHGRETHSAQDYDIFYTQGLTVTSTSIVWSPVAVLNRNTYGHSASPVVAVAHVVSPHLNVAYLWGSGNGETWDWETFYEGNEYDRYPHVYTPILLRRFTGTGGEEE